jgi:hypothetical protein
MNDYLILKERLARLYGTFTKEPTIAKKEQLKVERQELHNHYYRHIIKCNRCGCSLGRISFDPHGKIIGYKLGENFPECPECEEE